MNTRFCLETELREYVRYVCLDSSGRDGEPVGDRLVGTSFGDERENVSFARGQGCSVGLTSGVDTAALDVCTANLINGQ
jgi:hypothetical protein